ncbi:universal stress protein [Oceaniglobus roseus]|uniref:universal stress protein n=1 Tax=Oceaniglobus roseus TaxID=1737570 RepID=UPI000C7F4AC5|nr:universal stress protein [Kandeliimicrobium roseum]
MTRRSIVLVLFDTTEAEALIARAADVALGFEAHLTALHPFNPVMLTVGAGVEPMIFQSMLDWEETESKTIRAAFEEALRRNGLEGEFRAQSGLYGSEAFLLGGVRAADFVLIGATAGRSPDDRVLAHRIVRQAGRPVLVLGPGAELKAPATRIVIGWTETRESTRAAHDVLSLAAPGAEITLVALHVHADEVQPGLTGREDLAVALDRAGFKVTTMDRPAAADERPETLVRLAREGNAELLATGAFGHSQIYDMLVGAVTRDLLDSAPLPILLSC